MNTNTHQGDECDFWFKLCTEAFDRAMKFATDHDWGQFRIHKQQHDLLTLRFREAKKRIYGSG